MPSARPTATHSRSGFTLIELLIVVVVIGILAAIAIPKYSNVRNRASRGTMVATLRNLAAAEEAHFSDRNTYSTDFDSLDFHTATGITVAIVEATSSGWAATATRPTLGGSTCALFHGNAAAVAPAVVAGAIRCD